LPRANVSWQDGVQRAGERHWIECAGKCSSRNLRERVNAGIGASRSVYRHTFGGDGRERILDEALDRRAAALPLPADVVRAVVLKNQLQITRAIRV
jgi:hypothetical protein